MVHIVWLIAILFLPGLCILWLLDSSRFVGDNQHEGGAPGLIFPTSFALTVSLISLLSWLFFFINGNFQGVQITFFAIFGLLLAAALRKAWKLNIPSRWKRTGVRQLKPLLATWDFYIFLLITAVFFIALYSGAWFSHTADSLNHISAVRSLINFNNPHPMQIFWPDPVEGMDPTFGTWHVVLAVIANASGMELTALWLLATVFCAPLIVWSFVILANTITDNKLAGFLAGMVYVLVIASGDFRVAAQPNRMGQIIFWLVFVYLLLAVEAFIDQRKKSGFIFAGLSALFAWSCTAVHQQYAPAVLGIAFPVLLLMILTGISTRVLKKQKEVFPLKAVSGLGMAVLPTAAFGMVVRAVYTVSDPYPLTSQSAAGVITLGLWDQIYKDIEGWLSRYESFILFASLLSLFLIYFEFRDRLRNSGIFIIISSALLVPLSICFLSLTVGRGGLVSTVINRIMLLTPPFLVIGWSWVIVLLSKSLTRAWMQFSPRGLFEVLIAVTILITSGVYIYQNMNNPSGGLFSLYSPGSDYRFRVDISRRMNLLSTRDEAIRALMKLPDQAKILADINTGYEMNGLSGKNFLAYPSQHTPLQEKRKNEVAYYDVIDFMGGTLRDYEMVDVLKRHEVGYIYIDRERYTEQQIWDRLDAMPILDLTDGGENWRLYRVAHEKVEPYLTLTQKIEQTEDFFEKIGLYKEMGSLFSDPERYVRFLARELPVSTDHVAEFVSEGRFYTRVHRPGTYYSFITHLEQARVVSGESNAVYQTAFIVKGDPRGVIFQHPTSELVYTVDIPHNSRLDFSITLDPGSWEYGRGDGVEYLISIEQESGRKVIFQQYIDPKNVPAERRWLNYSLDLSAYGGERVNVIFETRPGPQNDNRYDWAGWGEPAIRLNVAENLLDDWSTLRIESEEDAEVKQMTLNLGGDKRNLLYQHPTSRVSVRVDLPQSPELRFGLGMLPEAWDPEKSDGMQFKVFIQDTAGGDILYQVFDGYLAPQAGAEPQWRDVVVDLSRFGGQRVELIFETLPGPDNNSAYDWGGWSSPAIVKRK